MTKLSSEQIQQILEGAPEGATHVDNEDYYFRQSDFPDEPWLIFANHCEWRNVEDSADIEGCHSIYDLLEILSLRQEVGRLKGEQSEVAARAVEEILNWQHSYIQSDEGFAYYDYAIEQYANELRRKADV